MNSKMKLSLLFLLLVGSQAKTVLKQKREVSEIPDRTDSSNESLKNEKIFKEEVFFSAASDSDLSCEQFDPLITGGSYECDTHDEFGKCILNCSTGNFHF